MLEVNIVNNSENHVEVGQIRYNEKGMYVLIVNEECGRFDAIVLNEGFNVRPFYWNSRGQSLSSILKTYPYIGKGKLEISR